MWKKEEDGQQAPTAPDNSPERPRPAKQASAPALAAEQATIGRSITIRGDVTGDEDLLIQGKIEGTVDLKQHSVTVGPQGRVKANLAGRTVTVEGEVDGDIRGQEQVSLKADSRVHGDIVSPRVVLEDGATFLGSIDMSGTPATTGAGSKSRLASIDESSATAVSNQSLFPKV